MKWQSLKALLIVAWFLWCLLLFALCSVAHDFVAVRLAFTRAERAAHDIRVVWMEKEPHIVHFSNGKAVDVGGTPVFVEGIIWFGGLFLGPAAVVMVGNGIVFPFFRHRRQIARAQ